MVSLSNHGLMLGVVRLASEDLTGADPSTGPIIETIDLQSELRTSG